MALFSLMLDLACAGGAMLARPYVTEVLLLIPSSQLRNPSLYCDLPLGTLRRPEERGGREGGRWWKRC